MIKKIVIRRCRTLGDRGKYMTWSHIQEQRNGLVTKLSWRTQTMQTHLEDHKRLGFFYDCAWLFFAVHISAESCTVNLLYGISKLLCKIDQRELEQRIWLFKLIYPGQVIQIAHLTSLSQDKETSLTESFHQLLLASSVCRPGDVRGRCAWRWWRTPPPSSASLQDNMGKICRFHWDLLENGHLPFVD